MRLYHGSNVEIDCIQLSKGRKGKDFGQGFYLSADYLQAARMAETVVQREGWGQPVVTVFEFDEEAVGSLSVLSFDGYTEEWAEFILKNRRNRSDVQAHSYDIVTGPIADDKVGVQVRQFLNGYIPFEVFKEKLKFSVPTIQYFFGTTEAVKLLKKI